MNTQSSRFLIILAVSSITLSGCASLNLKDNQRTDVRIEKVSAPDINIQNVLLYDSPEGTTIRGTMEQFSRFSYLSGHFHFDLYDVSGTRLESTKTEYRIRSKKRGMTKQVRFYSAMESSSPAQSRLVVTHHSRHDKEETLQERLHSPSSGRLRID